MKKAAYKTALIGLGKIGFGYVNDIKRAKYFRYRSHAQVLLEHPDFLFEAAMDPDIMSLDVAKKSMPIPFFFNSLEELEEKYQPEVIVLATPPQEKLKIIQSFSKLRAVIIEKPIAMDYNEARALVNYCHFKNILVQVNYWRRFDKELREMAQTKLKKLIGNIQAVFAVYGNGLLNNGTHLIDMIRFLLGEIVEVQSLGNDLKNYNTVLKGDININALLYLNGRMPVTIGCLDFNKYREVALDIWGENGRIEIMQESLIIRKTYKNHHRVMNDAYEISSEHSSIQETGASEALYELYSNLANALNNNEPLYCSGRDAILTEKVAANLCKSHQEGGRRILIDNSEELEVSENSLGIC